MTIHAFDQSTCLIKIICLEDVCPQKLALSFLRSLPGGHRSSLCQNVPMSICHVTFSRPLIGQKWEFYIVKEVIDVDELEEGHLISAAAEKQGN